MGLNINRVAELLPSHNYAPVFNDAEALHPVFGQELLSLIADQNHLSCVLHQQLVVPGHVASSDGETLPVFAPADFGETGKKYLLERFKVHREGRLCFHRN